MVPPWEFRHRASTFREGPASSQVGTGHERLLMGRERLPIGPSLDLIYAPRYRENYRTRIRTHNAGTSQIPSSEPSDGGHRRPHSSNRCPLRVNLCCLCPETEAHESMAPNRRSIAECLAAPDYRCMEFRLGAYEMDLPPGTRVTPKTGSRSPTPSSRHLTPCIGASVSVECSTTTHRAAA